MLLINHLKIRRGTKQTLHVRQKGCCYKYRLYVGERLRFLNLYGIQEAQVFLPQVF